MSSRSRVVWSEGMLLRTQHFQQQDRWTEGLVGGALALLGGINWGVARLVLDEGLLSQRKVGLRQCAGIMPDGTGFSIPDDSPSPEPLELPTVAQPVLVRLMLPVQSEGGVAIEASEGPRGGARFRAREIEVRDSNLGAEGREIVHIAEPHFTLEADGPGRGGATGIAVARVMAVESSGQLILDRDFIPPALTIAPTAVLTSFLEDLVGTLASIASERAAFVSGKRLAGAGDIADFLILMLCNRSEALARHLAAQKQTHPEVLFGWLTSLLGEASSFLAGEGRPAALPPYRHDEPSTAYLPLMQELRRVLLDLSRPDRKALQVPLKLFPSGVRAAEVQERALYDNATFIIAFNAPVPPETIRQRLPGQIKIGPAEELQNIVRAAVPGVPIRHLATVPREIPLHRGMVYFELDRNNDYWRRLATSAGLAFHVTGDLREGMDMECWAIRD